MFLHRSRAAAANIEERGQILVIGGSNHEGVLNKCELYNISGDYYQWFPPVTIQRENASVCTFFRENDVNQVFLFGGFDKSAVEDIEVIDLEFDSRGNCIKTWTILQDVSLLKPVECCGLVQLSKNELMIFGGL